MNACPGCGAPLLIGSKSCPECGWEKVTDDRLATNHTHNCEAYGCPESGTFNVEGKWYCKPHKDEAFKEIERRSQTAETRRDIARLRQYSKEGGLEKKPGESSGEYQRRCAKYIRDNIGLRIPVRGGE